MKKRILLFLITVWMPLSLLSTTVLANDPTTGIGIPSGDGWRSEDGIGTWYFFLSDDTVETNEAIYGDQTGDYYNGDAMRDTVFSEHLGLWTEATLDYAIWIPDSYLNNPHGRFALVTNDPVSQRNNVHPADLTPACIYRESTGSGGGGGGGTDPAKKVASSYFISQAAQDLVAELYGLDGVFVIVPVISNAGRVQDDATLPTQYSLLLLLMDALCENYPIDTNHIYGTGESVGGMILPQINTHRDNFFAGYVINGSQWYQNFYKDTVWNNSMISGTGMSANPARLERHYTLTDDRIIRDYVSKDKKGNKNDWLAWQNVYYMTSNNNLLVLSTDNAWNEWNAVIEGLTGYHFAQFASANNGADLQEQMEAADNTYRGTQMGLWWVSGIENGGSDNNPGVGNPYVGEWLLSQTRPTHRPKLDINRPFDGTPGSTISSGYTGVYHYTDIGSYFWDATPGAGSLFYNSIMLRPPGWLPSVQNTSVNTNTEAMPLEPLLTHPVTVARIQNVKKVSSDGSKLIVAIKYNVDMENAVIPMVNDKVQSEYHFVDNTANSNGFAQEKYPRADFVVMDSFDFYAQDGTKINELYDITLGDDNPEYITSMKSMISKIYINNAPKAVEDAGDRTGSGTYVIVEIATSANPQSVSVVQRTPIIAPKANALASANYKKIGSGKDTKKLSHNPSHPITHKGGELTR